MPVVITDIAGREPMVVLPFAEYESLLDSANAAPAQNLEEQIHLEPLEPNEVSAQQNRAQNPGPRVVGPTTPYLAAESAQPSAGACQLPEPSLEERFTFEPIP